MASPTAIDTNVLVYAQRREMGRHDAARAMIGRFVSGDTP